MLSPDHIGASDMRLFCLLALMPARGQRYGRSLNQQKEGERDQAEEGLHSKHNITFQGSILEVQRFANDDGLSVIFFADKRSWQL